MAMKKFKNSKIQNICIRTTNYFIALKYEHQKVEIRVSVNFWLVFQISQMFEIVPFIRVVGSESKHLSRHRLFVDFVINEKCYMKT